jgi:hypothetical protein
MRRRRRELEARTVVGDAGVYVATHGGYALHIHFSRRHNQSASHTLPAPIALLQNWQTYDQSWPLYHNTSFARSEPQQQHQHQREAGTTPPPPPPTPASMPGLIDANMRPALVTPDRELYVEPDEMLEQAMALQLQVLRLQAMRAQISSGSAHEGISGTGLDDAGVAQAPELLPHRLQPQPWAHLPFADIAIDPVPLAHDRVIEVERVIEVDEEQLRQLVPPEQGGVNQNRRQYQGPQTRGRLQNNFRRAQQRVRTFTFYPVYPSCQSIPMLQMTYLPSCSYSPFPFLFAMANYLGGLLTYADFPELPTGRTKQPSLGTVWSSSLLLDKLKICLNKWLTLPTCA